MDNAEARREALSLMAEADIACVTTLDAQGGPESRAMFNLRNGAQFPGLRGLFAGMAGGFETYFTTNTSSLKVAQLAAHPQASVFYALPGQFRGLCVKGRLEPVTDDAVKKALWQPGWEMYYPGGWRDPDNTVLRLCPGSIKYYHQMSRFTFTPEP